MKQNACESALKQLITRISIIVNISLRNGNKTLGNTETLYILKSPKWDGNGGSFYFGQVFLPDCTLNYSTCEAAHSAYRKPHRAQLLLIPVTHSCQAGPRWNFIRDVLPVDMTNSRTWNIEHFSSTHPNLKRGNLKVYHKRTANFTQKRNYKQESNKS